MARLLFDYAVSRLRRHFRPFHIRRKSCRPTTWRASREALSVPQGRPSRIAMSLSACRYDELRDAGLSAYYLAPLDFDLIDSDTGATMATSANRR